MGWGRTFLLGDIGNRLDIGDVEDEVERIKRDLRSSERNDVALGEQLDILTRENAELKLYLTAIVRLLITKQVVTKEEIETIVGHLDTADGVKDGRHKGPIV